MMWYLEFSSWSEDERWDRRRKAKKMKKKIDKHILIMLHQSTMKKITRIIWFKNLSVLCGSGGGDDDFFSFHSLFHCDAMLCVIESSEVEKTTEMERKEREFLSNDAKKALSFEFYFNFSFNIHLTPFISLSFLSFQNEIVVGSKVGG